MLLAGDVGGTKTIFALFDPARGPCIPISTRLVESADYESFEDALADFLASCGEPVESASFGVAGPVLDGCADLTNLSWVVSAEVLRHRFGFDRVLLLNDLVAMASALPLLRGEDIVTLHEGISSTHGTKAIIAPGTGLGQAFLIWDGHGYVAHPSEGGHADFAPRDELQRELLAYLEQRFDHVSYERVCSGRGIPNIYDFLRHSGVAAEPGWLASELAGAVDRTPVIVRGAFDVQPPVELCVATLRVFASILAAEAGNLALSVLATGGVYLGGGLPPRVLPLLIEPAFVQAFHGKGRMTETLERIPLHVVARSDAALIGAAARGLAALTPG